MKKIKNNRGFSLLEIIIYLAILSFILFVVASFIFYFNNSNLQSKADREILENARRVLEEINYEITAAEGIYTPTTNTSQLSLETSKYVPTGESTSYIDFFMCGMRICLKKESQNPIFLTSDTVKVNSLTFTRTVTNGFTTIRTNLILQYGGILPQVSLTSSASLRNY